MDTSDFIVEILRVGAALFVVAGSIAILQRYDVRMAWTLAAIIILGVLVHNQGSANSITSFLETVMGGSKSLAKRG